MLLYFTSGTTALPKLVEHTHTSYPIGHLSTMYWMGLRPGDVHLNISSPGWAKHAWSNVFAPWLAGATVLVYNFARFDPAALLHVLDGRGRPPSARRRRCGGCWSRPTWRARRRRSAECLSAGEPLNPEVIEQVRDAWGITIRDGYGQTETTCPGRQPARAAGAAGSMGRPLPGYRVTLVDPATGEVRRARASSAWTWSERPVPLMTGYQERADVFDEEQNAFAFAGGVYHTGDVVSRDDDGYFTYVGRADDVFKASDYRISPFELESVLIEHPAVAEAAVVPAPDPIRLAVPKAYVMLADGQHRRRGDGPRRSSATPGSTWRRTSGSAGWSSPSCPRRSAARSGASSCGGRKSPVPAAARASSAIPTSSGEDRMLVRT